MAQNMQTQWQTGTALISLLWSAPFAGEVRYVPALTVCLPRPELLKVHSFRLLRYFLRWQHGNILLFNNLQ